MIKIIVKMTKDIMIFMVLWTINLVFFICVGMLLFAEIETFRSFWDTFIKLFDSALGNFDFELWDDTHIGRHTGQIYLIIFLLLNYILLMNLIIAILSTTYALFETKGLAMYYNGIINAIPAL